MIISIALEILIRLNIFLFSRAKHSKMVAILFIQTLSDSTLLSLSTSSRTQTQAETCNVPTVMHTNAFGGLESWQEVMHAKKY